MAGGSYHLAARLLKHDERVIGTADDLAPEQAIDGHSVDSRAGIYGLGCTFYCVLTGHPQFTEGSLVQRLMANQLQLAPKAIDDTQCSFGKGIQRPHGASAAVRQ